MCPLELFPLNCGWWFGGDIVADAVHAFYLVDYLVAHPMHEIIRKFRPIGRHGIYTGNGTQGYGIVKRTLIAHDTNGAVGQQDCACLPYLVIKTPLSQTVYEYGIGLLENGNLMRSDIAYDTHSKTGTRERMTANEMLRNTQAAAYGTDLILEQPLERLAELESHLLGQTAHIVMALDGLTGNVQALNTIRVYGTLRQPFGISYLLCLGIKYLNEVAANYLAFLLRLGNTLQVLEELVRCIHALNVQAQADIVVEHIGKLILTQQTVIYEYAGQVLAYSLVEQHCCYR